MRPVHKTASLSAIAVLLILLTLFFPQILSSAYGKKSLIRSLEEKTRGQVSVERLKLTWFGPQTIEGLSVRRPDFDASVESLQIDTPLWYLSKALQIEELSRTQRNFTLNNGTFELHQQGYAPAKLEHVQATILVDRGSAACTASGGSSQDGLSGGFSLKTQTSDIHDLSTNTSVQFECSRLPVVPLATMAQLQGIAEGIPLAEILGQSLSGSGSLLIRQQKGTLDLLLQTANVNGELHASLLDRVLVLTQPLTATFRITPDLSRMAMRNINPLFLTAIESQNPIQLRVEARNFRCPILPFSLDRLQIGQATIDAGKAVCRNGNALAAIISILKRDFLTKPREMEVWFTPCSFRLANGVLSAGRMDALLANDIHVCIWGTVNLVHDRLDMTLGLPADTLAFSFGLKRLSPDYVLKIPVSGSTKDPNVATGVAAAKIAALMASQKAPGGGFTGGLLNVFAQPDADVPPSSRPFPWERTR